MPAPKIDSERGRAFSYKPEDPFGTSSQCYCKSADNAGHIDGGSVAAVRGIHQGLADAVNMEQWQQEIWNVHVSGDERRADKAKDSHGKAHTWSLVDGFEF